MRKSIIAVLVVCAIFAVSIMWAQPTGPQGSVTALALVSSTSATISGTFTGFRKMELFPSPNYAGTIIAGGTIAISGTGMTHVELFPPLPNPGIAVVVTITSGTLGTLTFY